MQPVQALDRSHCVCRYHRGQQHPKSAHRHTYTETRTLKVMLHSPNGMSGYDIITQHICPCGDTITVGLERTCL